MTNELRDRFFGETIEQRLRDVTAELEIDAVGLWQIASFGEDGFGLSAEALTDYVRRHILVLLAAGAKPVVGRRHGPRYWLVVDYGSKPDEIAEAIIRDWKLGGCEADPGGVWFALPHIYEEIRPQQTGDPGGKSNA
jgi:hypothetical protein